MHLPRVRKLWPPDAGFTLVELLVTVVIIAILAAISVSGYSQYVRRAQRTDATAALLRISSAQERFYLQHGRYAGPAELAPAPPDGLGMPGTEHDFYELDLAEDEAGLAVGYVATARARADGPQAKDTQCRAFTIDNTGMRGAETADGATGTEITERCWR